MRKELVRSAVFHRARRATSLGLLVVPILAGVALALWPRPSGWVTPGTVFQVKLSPASMRQSPGHYLGSDCASCHRMDPALSHPMGIPPALGSAAGLPLANGVIACITCHDVSQAPRGDGRSMLRGGANGIGLCLQCHQGSTSDTATAHALGITWAHLPTGTDRKSLASGSLDSETQACIECHDGTVAGDAGSHARGVGPFNLGRDHPIGMPYRSRPANAFSDAIDVVPAAGLDRRIRLFDRAVGCGSCHNVYSKVDHLLVMSNRGSQLCLKCHVY